MTNAQSVKARLKNQAKAEGTTMQEKLTAYGLERTLYRISVSKYSDHFTLKGGILMYGLFHGEYSRVTADIDFLAEKLNGDAEKMKRIFSEVFSQEHDDALQYDLNTLDVHRITEFKDYPGINVSVITRLDRTRIPVSIDIGFGDVIFPERTWIEFPVLLDMEAPALYAYPVSTVIAEKFEAIVSLGYANSRYKDFYDIYMIASEFELNGSELAGAVRETFFQRKTKLDDIAAFEKTFSEDIIRQKRWTAFVRKKKVMKEVEFEEAISSVKALMLPVVEALQQGNSFNRIWMPKEVCWIELSH